MKLIKGILFFLIMQSALVYSQARSDEQLELDLKELAKSQPGYNEKIQISVSGVTLRDFISAIAYEHNLNISVDDNLNQSIVNNFYDAVVVDVLIFLTKQYKLDIEVTGSIVAFHKRPEEQEKPVIKLPKVIDITYKSENDFLSVNLKQDTLAKVAEMITRASQKNVILSPRVKDQIVTVYIENRPFEQVIEMMAKSNGLIATVDKEGFYFLDLPIPEVENNKTQRNSKNKNLNEPELNNVSLNGFDRTRLDVEATNADISDIIEAASNQLGEHYFMYDKPEGTTTLKVKGVNFIELLSHILNGTDFTFKKAENYFLIGKRNTEGLRATELIRLENRTIETVIELIPSELLQGIEVKEFVELNGIVVSGSYLKITELKSFIKSVDQVVPMVQIDIMIVFSERSSGVTKEMRAGISDQPTNTEGQIFPGLDMTLGAESINALIDAFNGFGIINIGSVTPNFYASLRFLESNSVIDITSTPKISTLNGHEATFSVGESSYYQEERVNVESSIGGPIQVSNKVWEKTDANLEITVKPIVSADEYVTLEISVSQNDFQGRVDPTAPPNQTTQSFVSLIRVKDGEMILMGGLEKDSDSNSGSGTPFLSRIPGLKWLFSDREKLKEKSKLHIFIKPTVTY